MGSSNTEPRSQSHQLREFACVQLPDARGTVCSLGRMGSPAEVADKEQEWVKRQGGKRK